MPDLYLLPRSATQLAALCLGLTGRFRLGSIPGADPQLRNFDDLRAVELAASRACLRLLRHTAA